MPLENTAHQITQSPGQKPRAADIAKSLKDADSPMDFIRANLRQPEQAPPAIDPQAISQQVQAERAQAPAEPHPATTAQAAPAPKAEPAKPLSDDIDLDLDAGSKQAAPVTPEPEAPKQVEPESGPAVSLSAMRKQLNETKTVLKAKDDELAAARARIHEFESGQALPKIVEDLEQQVQTLSRYEKLHNLKSSKEYQDTYVKPMDAMRGRLKEIGTSYQIPDDVLEEGMNIRNERELNEFLTEHFDQIAGAEVKSLITNLREVQKAASQAEKEPAAVLERLQAEGKRAREAETLVRRSKIAQTSKDAWADSLIEIRQQGKAQELIADPNNPERTRTVVTPIVQAAAKEYSSIMRALMDAGLSDIPKEVAFAMARMVQLAHASAISIDSRNAAIEHAERIEQNSRRTNPMVRPPMGATGAPYTPPAAPAPTSPANAADQLLSSIMPRYR